ncbi:hypothetical protein P9112_001907 [Eukaryota sp. TZLM1-RC]
MSLSILLVFDTIVVTLTVILVIHLYFVIRKTPNIVPRAYDYVLRRLLCKLSQSVRTFVYTRPGWRYHGKAVYVFPNQTSAMTFIGSSNYSKRSKRRDVESSLVLITQNQELIEKLHQEREVLTRHTEKYEACPSLDCPVSLKGLVNTFDSVL